MATGAPRGRSSLENRSRQAPEVGAGETPADYCKGYTDKACDRIIAIIKSRTNPSYCKPEFAVAGSPENQGLTSEQIRICYLMSHDFTKLPTTR